jgi:hypothetical protein
VLAAKQAAAAAQAEAARRAKARQLKKQRRAARLAAARKAAKARLRAHLAPVRRTATAPAATGISNDGASGGGSVRLIVPIGALTAIGALLILGVGLGRVPTTPVSRAWMSAGLREHSGQFTLLAGLVLLSVGISFALTLLHK